MGQETHKANGLFRLTVPSFPPERKGEHSFLSAEGEVYVLGKRERCMLSGRERSLLVFLLIFTGCVPDFIIFLSDFHCNFKNSQLFPF